MEHSLDLVEFGAAKFITNGVDFSHDRFEVIQEKKLRDHKTYSEVCIFELHKYIETDFFLIIQADGFVLNPDKWSSSFLDYDYIGAVAHLAGIDPPIVGNGGFSLRSKKILHSTLELAKNESELKQRFKVQDYFFEDYVLCVVLRHFLEDRGIKFAPLEVANQFSVEPFCINSPKNSFGFHYGHFY